MEIFLVYKTSNHRIVETGDCFGFAFDWEEAKALFHDNIVGVDYDDYEAYRELIAKGHLNALSDEARQLHTLRVRLEENLTSEEIEDLGAGIVRQIVKVPEEIIDVEMANSFLDSFRGLLRDGKLRMPEHCEDSNDVAMHMAYTMLTSLHTKARNLYGIQVGSGALRELTDDLIKTYVEGGELHAGDIPPPEGHA